MIAKNKIRLSVQLGLIVGGILLLIFGITVFYNSASFFIALIILTTGTAGMLILTASIAKLYMKKCVFYQADYCELSKCPVWGSDE